LARWLVTFGAPSACWYINDTKIRLALTVFDNHNLRRELLCYGAAGEVLAPPALRAS
jgi:hypothetical protein